MQLRHLWCSVVTTEMNLCRSLRSRRKKIFQKKFLEQILLEMRNAGILYSKKGAGGGYSLNKAPEDVFLSQVMRLIDGPIALLPCVSLNFYRSCEECTEEHACGIRDTFVEVRNAMLQILNDTSIAHLINKEKELNLNVE